MPTGYYGDKDEWVVDGQSTMQGQQGLSGEGASAGDALIFDGSKWVPSEALAANFTSPEEGQFVGFNSAGELVNLDPVEPSITGLPTYKVAATDASRTADTTLSKDAHFDLAVTAGEQWLVEYFLFHASGSQTPDIKIALVAPASSTGWWGIDGLVESATSSSGQVRRLAATSFNTSNSMSVATNTTALWTRVGGVVTVGTTGTFELWWAQNTSDAAASTIKAGSLLRASKVN